MTKSPAENQTFYNQYHKHENRGHANWLGKIKPISAGNFTYYFHLQLLKPFLSEIKNLTILDVGCGVGTLSLFLASQGAKKILGIDLAPDAIAQAETARKALHLKNLSFRSEKITATTGKFDLIIASEIIEHVPDAKKFVTLLSANLKKGGSLILTTPYAHNYLRDHGYLKQHDIYAGHLTIFDEKRLLALFPKTDWEIVRLQQTEGPLRMLLFITPLGKLIKLIRGPLVPLFHAIDEFLAKVFGKHDLQLVAKRR